MDVKEFEVNKTLPYDPSLLAVNISLRQIEEIASTVSQRCHVSGVNEIAWALRALMLTDLTTLAGDDTAANVRRLCLRACYPFEPQFFDKFFERALLSEIHTAAVCVYPARVKDAYQALQQYDKLNKVAIAAVATGFPTGQYGLQTRLQEISHAILAGATEIDIVINRQLALVGDWEGLYNEVVLMRSACGNAHLKTILAIGELGTMENVYKAAMVCMLAGADFIKTSTGKESVNATLPVGLVMIFAIQEFKRRTCQIVGLKPAGGVRTVRDAIAWMTLVNETLGMRWLRPERFRFGASGLLDDIEKVVREGVAKLEAEEAEKAKKGEAVVEQDPVETLCKELRKTKQEK
ncbi:GL11189 [Drosophila persimilis]|uniref:deoxyribose-phosphate aldolase n=2 Tax=pseudoobscura subgroup TaxID=32358 RepID=A0A6I8UT52_DROPS|nr:deoxyribose-phosphate aldolase [Drosophila pseudoobscura]XP_002015652.1 deoxyribose-phosphate aldolase [Drosophila persimilis]XP_017145860.1 deoxyribose-phosphate aldolase [Drosophila miranda]EDW31542.1 GL11189 [Drosophila persimilis]